VAATWGGKVHEEARKARDLAADANVLLASLAASTGSANDAAMKTAAA
jgi:diacylglycerol kinase